LVKNNGAYLETGQIHTHFCARLEHIRPLLLPRAFCRPSVRIARSRKTLEKAAKLKEQAHGSEGEEWFKMAQLRGCFTVDNTCKTGLTRKRLTSTVVVAQVEAIVRTFLKSGMAALLCTALTFSTAMAAPSASMGVIIQAEHASLGSVPIANGSAIFDGDQLLTDASGNLRARLGQSQIYMMPNSNILVHRLSSGFSASMGSGTVVFSTAAGETFQVLANGATIQPATDKPTLAQVTYINANELLLTSRHGDLLVSMGDESKTVTEGSSYRMMIQPGSGPGPQGMFSTGKNRFVLVLIVAAAVTATVTTILALETDVVPEP
jgi:hypothetical protein